MFDEEFLADVLGNQDSGLIASTMMAFEHIYGDVDQETGQVTFGGPHMENWGVPAPRRAAITERIFWVDHAVEKDFCGDSLIAQVLDDLFMDLYPDSSGTGSPSCQN
jgi:hypothetical protein